MIFITVFVTLLGVIGCIYEYKRLRSLRIVEYIDLPDDSEKNCIKNFDYQNSDDRDYRFDNGLMLRPAPHDWSN